MTDKTPPGKTEGKPAAKPAAKTDKPAEDKKPRAKPVPYGFLPGATITITAEAAKKTYKGKRLEYFERLKACDGKKVEDFAGACPTDDPPRGWLRFFIQDGAATLAGGAKPEPKPKPEKKKEEKAAA